MPSGLTIENFINYITREHKFGKIELTSRRYRQLAADGKVPAPVNGVINTGEAILALLAYYQRLARDKDSPTLLDERARLTKSQADRIELKLQKERGEVIHTETAMKEWGRVVQNIRQRLLAMPVKMAPQLYGVDSISEIKERIQKQIYDVLTELADANNYKEGKNVKTKPANRKKKP